MKLKNLLALILTAFLFPSLYAQEQNPEMHILSGLKILDEPSTIPFEFDFAGNQEIYRQPISDEFIQSPTTEIDSNLAQLLQNVLDEAIAEYNIKGLSAALSTPNGDIWKGVSGISHDTVEVTTDMLFGIASITKTFIATIIMQLYEDDSLELGDSIYKWLPPFDNIDSTVTIRQLLNHTSGIYNVTNHPGYIDSVFVAGSRIWTPEEILETFVLSPSFLPGTDYEYSNTNYKLLGMIIEEITGNEVVSEIHNRLTIPLELNSTFLFPDEEYEGVRSHVWYPIGNDTLDVTHLVDTTAFSAAWTSGGIISTAEDLVKWSKGLNEGEILNDTTLALMKVPAPYSNGYYGLGTSIRYLYQLPIYGHSGNYIYRSQLWYLPFDSLSISVLSNQQLPSITGVWNSLYFAYKDFLLSQPCLPDGITFSSQSEIDNFQANHPDCTEIEGDVTISGSDITNLNGLSVLTSIGGNLGISNSPFLSNLSGLDNLLYIGGNLSIGNYIYNYNIRLKSLTGLEGLTFIGGNLSILVNDSLSNLTGLEGLTSIGGDIYINSGGYITYPSLESLTGLENVTLINGSLIISGNYALTSLAALENVTSIGGNLQIYWNNALTSLTGLDNVSTIGGGLSIGQGVVPPGGPSDTALISLIGLEGLTSIGGGLSISDQAALTDLTGLDNVTSVGESISIYNNNLTSLTGLEGLTSIEGNLFIYANYTIISLSGLENVTSIGGNLNIVANHSLTNLTGMDNVTSIEGSILIGSPPDNSPGFIGNDSLTNLIGLEGLTFIVGDLHILGNNFLTSLIGLNNVTSIGGNLDISGNASLTSLTGLENVTTIEGNVSVGWDDVSPGYGNDSLTNLTGLDNLTTIGGNFSVYNNHSLTYLSGLENLTSIEGNLSIGTLNDWGGSSGNPALVNLSGLDNLTSIAGTLSISSNDTLNSLSGLDNIDAGTIGNLSIYNNQSLSSCEVQSICDYLISPNGEIEIYDNAPGCNSQEEVEDACDAITYMAINGAENYSIFPNPVKDILTFSSEDITSIEIYDMMGSLILRQENNKVDMTNLPPGIYFVVGFDENLNTLYQGKIVKN